MLFQNGAKYETNYSRAAAYYLSTCAPEPKGKKRLAAYNLIKGIYTAILNNPSDIGFKPTADVYFGPWEQQKERKKDVKSIRDPIDKIEALIKELFDVVEAGEVRKNELILPSEFPTMKKQLAKALAAVDCGIENDGQVKISMPQDCAEGLKELAAISKENIIQITDGPQENKGYLLFSRCVFEPSDNWTAKAFDALLKADGRLIKLCAELEKQGFERVDCRDGKKISLDYVKPCGKKIMPLKASWADQFHYGIEVTYEELRLEPCYFWLRMPVFKETLEKADKLPENVREFICSNTKTCDGCRYCVQTDKTGTRPLAAVKVNGKMKCPRFPAFSMNWRDLSPELSEAVIPIMKAIDEIVG